MLREGEHCFFIVLGIWLVWRFDLWFFDLHVWFFDLLPCDIKLVTLRGDFPALFPSLTPQSELVDNTYSCWLPNFERFLYYSLCRIVADHPKSTISLVLPWVIKLVTLRFELETRPGLALGPLGAP